MPDSRDACLIVNKVSGRGIVEVGGRSSKIFSTMGRINLSSNSMFSVLIIILLLRSADHLHGASLYSFRLTLGREVVLNRQLHVLLEYPSSDGLIGPNPQEDSVMQTRDL